MQMHLALDDDSVSSKQFLYEFNVKRKRTTDRSVNNNSIMGVGQSVALRGPDEVHGRPIE